MAMWMSKAFMHSFCMTPLIHDTLVLFCHPIFFVSVVARSSSGVSEGTFVGQLQFCRKSFCQSGGVVP